MGTGNLTLEQVDLLVFNIVQLVTCAAPAGPKRGAAMQEAADATPSGMVSILGLER